MTFGKISPNAQKALADSGAAFDRWSWKEAVYPGRHRRRRCAYLDLDFGGGSEREYGA